MALFFILFIFLGQNAKAENFDWKKLKGQYEFVSCSTATNPVWSSRPAETFIQIDVDRSVPQRHTLKVHLFNKAPSPIALSLPLRLINQGPYKRYNAQGKLNYKSESFTYSKGLQSFVNWQNKNTQGWSSFHIENLEEGLFRYEMKQYRSNTGEFKSEVCQIKRV